MAIVNPLLATLAHEVVGSPMPTETAVLAAEADPFWAQVFHGNNWDDVSDVPEPGSSRPPSDAGMSVVSCSSASGGEPTATAPKPSGRKVRRLNLDALSKQPLDIITLQPLQRGSRGRALTEIEDGGLAVIPQIGTASTKPPLAPKFVPAMRRPGIVRLNATPYSSSEDDFEASEVYVATTHSLRISPPPPSLRSRNRQSPPASPSASPIHLPEPPLLVDQAHSIAVQLGNIVPTSEQAQSATGSTSSLSREAELAARHHVAVLVGYFIGCLVAIVFALAIILLQFSDTAGSVRLATVVAMVACGAISICVCVHVALGWTRPPPTRQLDVNNGAVIGAGVLVLVGVLALVGAMSLEVVSRSRAAASSPATSTAMSALHILAVVLPGMAEFVLVVHDCGTSA